MVFHCYPVDFNHQFDNITQYFLIVIPPDAEVVDLIDLLGAKNP
jgi:hypothetical protein